VRGEHNEKKTNEKGALLEKELVEKWREDEKEGNKVRQK
jgi:hypothetical protein